MESCYVGRQINKWKVIMLEGKLPNGKLLLWQIMSLEMPYEKMS
jgi:hypothetical protein